MKKEQTLFRKDAIEYLSKPELFKTNPILISYSSWFFMIMIYIIIIAVVIWGIFGSIPITTQGQGIIITENGNVYNAVSIANNAIINKLLVRPGQLIKKNQAIAIVDQTSLEDQIKVLAQYQELLKKEYEGLELHSIDNIAKNKAEIEKQNEAISNEIKLSEKTLVTVGDLLESRRIAYAKGIIPKQDYVATYQSYQSLQEQIEQTKQKLAQNNLAELKLEEDWKERLRELHNKIIDTQKEMENLKAQQNSTTVIKSPVDGVVISMLKNLGDSVSSGTPIAGIATVNSDALDAVVFVPASEGKKIKMNMPALVSPTIVKKTEYGSIKGVVSQVSEYPIPAESVRAILQNQELVEKFTKEESPFGVRIHLISDKSTYSGLKWSSSSGPEQKITPGTIVDVEIIVREQSPISLLIPILRSLITT